MSEPEELSVGHTTNTAHLVTKDGRVAVSLLLETSIQGEDRRKVLLYHVLRTASHAIVEVECMTDEQIASQLAILNAMNHELKVVPK